MSPELVLSKVEPGYGPRYEQDDFPDPPRDVTFRKLMAVLGPAIIALGGTIGGGEWLRRHVVGRDEYWSEQSEAEKRRGRLRGNPTVVRGISQAQRLVR